MISDPAKQRNRKRNDVLGKPSIKTAPRGRTQCWAMENAAPENND
jgi:hypothetical protein